MTMLTIGNVLLGPAAVAAPPAWTISACDDAPSLATYRQLRRDTFVAEQGLFAHTDADDLDDDPRTVVLVARSRDGDVLGGVRLTAATGRDIGWWNGSRLVVSRQARHTSGIGPALIRAACAHAEDLGALRFEATVQLANEPIFRQLGWDSVRPVTVAAVPHVLMRWPINRFRDQAKGSKSALGPLLAGLHLGGGGFVGDDGAPVPGSDLVAACDAIVPSMVERDPEWAGWCGVLVNINDLTAMGATPVGLLDAVAARDASFAARIVSGLRAASQAWRTPILGGHTQLGVPAALSLTALGRAARPVPGGGGRPGHEVRLTADLAGDWRPGFRGMQWDSTTSRTSDELCRLAGFTAAAAPAAAKDVSMAGIVGTLGMLAEASGCGAVLDVEAAPAPSTARLAEWLSCFPGFAMITTDTAHACSPDPGPATTSICGELTSGTGVQLRWPDGEQTEAISGGVTGLGAA